MTIPVPIPLEEKPFTDRLGELRGEGCVTMSGFTVDPDALSALGKTMLILAAKLDDARVITNQISVSDFGSPTATSAATDFVNHWTFQATRLSTTLEDVGGRLGDAARDYSAADVNAVDTANQLLSNLT